MIDKKKINTIYIISKGRPQCTTAKTLTRIGYPGEWFIVCGNNDETIPQYQKNWGKNKVLIFDWYEEVKKSDLLDNFGYEKMPSGAVPARNATRDISLKRGELRHWQFDDDYVGFARVDYDFKKNHRVTGEELEKELFNIALFGYEANLPNVGFILGTSAYPSTALEFSKRIFNAHNLANDENLFVRWRGRLNDDLINAIDVYYQGKLEYAFNYLSLLQKQTQKEAGGLTDLYQNYGTVRKTAYPIMVEPKAVKLTIKFGRYHHDVDWDLIVPKLIREKWARY